jgi:L-lactate dehydrogenase complex protein LldG
MTAREHILRRVREAVMDLPSEATPIPRGYSRTHERDDLVTTFLERVSDYRARVRRTSIERLPAEIESVLTELHIHSVAVPADLPTEWFSPTSIKVSRDDPPLSATELDAIDAVITGCAVGIAETGTIGLNAGAAQGRRVLTLLPDVHVCVVSVSQIVGDVPEGLEALDPRSPLTLISGPSATSDIELERVEGVHGPRTLIVFITD